MMYKCLKENSYEDADGYQLVPLREEDIENIRLWRNLQNGCVKAKTPIAAHEQNTYFHHIVWPTFVQQQPKQILFSYLHHRIGIGYGG